MNATRLTPTTWQVESSRTLQCDRAGCNYMVAIGAHRKGDACPECSRLKEKLNRPNAIAGKLEPATYHIDLEEYTQTGSCSCPRFRCHIEPIVKRQTPGERRLERNRCHHILLCRELAKEDSNFDDLLAMLPQQGMEEQI